MNDFLYLASQSPRRHELLRQFGLRTEPLVAAPDEDAESLEATIVGESPTNYVRRVTDAKLRAALARLATRGLPAAPVLVADTTVALGGRILGKPRDAADAADMLAALAGRTHRVLTAVALARPRPQGEGWNTDDAISVSRVTFARLKPAEIERYVESGESLDKAGAYGLQGRAAAFVKRVDGSPSGIIGLPLHETAKLLRRAGFTLP